MFVWALNDVDNISFSENIVVVYVSIACVPPPSFEDTDTWLTGVSQ